MPFSQTWTALQTTLSAGMPIENWTQAKGLLGDSFTIVNVAAGFIEVNTPNASNLQRVPRADFELVYRQWTHYSTGQTRRHEIRDETRFSKYIISILHWLEQQSGGALP
jgi:hypothetical protein